ncbi:MAG: histidine kinase [Blautia sp.]|nr:histidine kinase [Lachnoclostridium sp.]MCM1210226.1 histidine kinase [Blautia sp.]
MRKGIRTGSGYGDARLEERQRVVRRINPHFVFNTLAAIRIETKNDSDIAYDLIYDFSKHLRAVFQSLTHMENISIREEISNITSYINLIKIRFGNNITIHMDWEEAEFMLPPMSIQPLVENAVMHGLKKGKRKGIVQIRSCQTATEYIVQVEDDGIGFEMDKDMEKYIENDVVPQWEDDFERGGLQRVRCQIAYMTGGNVEIQSVIDYGTVVTLHIPKSLGKN